MNISPFDSAEIDTAEEQAEKDRAEAERISAIILSAINYLERAAGASREAQERLRTRTEEARSLLNSHLHHNTPAVRRAVWEAILMYEFSRPLENRAEVEELLTNLVKRGILVENPEGYLMAYQKTYMVSPESRFEESEIAKVKRDLVALLQRVYQEVGKTREQKAALLRSQSTLDLAGLLAGQQGKCLVEVPTEKVVQNGKGFWRGGGTLLVASDGQKILPLGAVGSIGGVIQEAMDLNVHLWLQSLQRTAPPFIERLPSEQGRKVQLFWHLLKRAIQAAEEKEKLQAQRQEMADRTTTPPEEFFLEGRPGICLVDFQGVWRVPAPDGTTAEEIPHLFFLLERTEGEGTKRLQIVEVPNHLKEFLAPCLGKEYPEEGNRFVGMAYPLNAILQAVYGQILQASRDAEKASQIANGR